ncbi:TetR/AcrR family transcriptional regulator [Nocardia concava]|uniref:TetR/AcrR family transcriptional regulator n=1 Tax=Nocardia concava TaxID=257281 RepID=UPI0005925EEA|nr:TetR/AcrR family transcriptional regulator [Nocardia concava]
MPPKRTRLPTAPETARRMPRAERREQLLDAATRVVAANGFAATGLDQIAAAAGVSHVILYRHFDSKADLYRAALERAYTRLGEAVGTDAPDRTSIPALLAAAAADPDAFRLLFRHALREPDFHDVSDMVRGYSTLVAQGYLAQAVPAGPWQDWAAAVIPAYILDAVIAWLDVGQPALEDAADRIARGAAALVEVAKGETTHQD